MQISTSVGVVEHGLKERIVIIEFPSLEKAIAARESDAYGEALKALGDGAVRDFRIIEGLDDTTRAELIHAPTPCVAYVILNRPPSL
jgi:hypothetical protein